MTDKDIDKENDDLVIKRKEEATRVSGDFSSEFFSPFPCILYVVEVDVLGRQFEKKKLYLINNVCHAVDRMNECVLWSNIFSGVNERSVMSLDLNKKVNFFICTS